MPEILVTGGSGQLGGAIVRQAGPGWTIHAPDRATLDIADPAAVMEAIGARRWHAVINCAAYTAVDRAEEDAVAAWTVNAVAPAAIAAATKAANIPLVHVSTDYVFDGTKAAAYDEGDPIAPLGVYGASKEGGEQAVRTGSPAHVIVRTAWVVSAHGSNFVKTMLRLGAERNALNVVADQYGCPTGANDVALAVLTIADRLLAGTGAYGTFHFVNAGEATWAALASHVFDRATHHGRARTEVNAITTAEYPTPARRPANSRLACARIQSAFGITPRHWHAAVDEIVDDILLGQHQV